MEEITYNEFIQNILNTRGRFGCGDEYHERHHIVPKCLGGTDEKENLIDLFAREHFEAHRLLALENPENDSLAYAWTMMAFVKDKNQERYELTPEEYEEARIKQSRLAAKRFTGENNPMYGKRGENSPMFGKHHSEEVRKKISKGNKGKQISETTRQKMKENHTDMSGENNPMYGKHFSDESREKMRESAVARCTEEWKKNMSEQKKELFSNPCNHPFYGRHHSEETKEKLRKRNLGHVVSEETKEKLRQFFSGDNNPNARKIIRLSDLVVYNCLSKAAQENNLHRTTMRKRCLKHKEFMYYDEWMSQQNNLVGDIDEQNINSKN